MKVVGYEQEKGNENTLKHLESLEEKGEKKKLIYFFRKCILTSQIIGMCYRLNHRQQ